MVMESYSNIPLDDLSRFLIVSNVLFPRVREPFYTNFKQYISLAAKNLSISVGSKSPNIPLNFCKCSTEKAYFTRDIGTQTVRKFKSKSSTLLPDYIKHFLVAIGD